MKSDKLYYTIGEVGKIAGLPTSVLRFWETEFEGLRPHRNRSGKRLYKQAEIDGVLQIKKLLYEDRFTIEGARSFLKQNRSSEGSDSQNGASVQDKMKVTAEEIKQDIEDILDILDK
ncbi:MerR family transcriptional regulator [candidate division LCP-89 bacterium B3_LCP]|uniref:MerR family transcriptional regulator n=1 Tax=candidate division LCP-89 bacterium B3_LCP TaxID=2012998 RepID=A0A532V3X3_UNCL8|nr:MAG: MerR family transcriptional regulator [candidate division LCP-89 bacterium B3_LCP]